MEKLQKLYSQSNVTLVQLAVKTGISTSTIHRYVSGKVKVSNPDYYNPIYKALEDLHSKTDVIEIKEDKDIVDINASELKEQMNRNAFVSTYVQNRVIKRGDIWYTKNFNSTGGEMWGSRPCVILSVGKINESMNTVEIVYITGSPKAELPTHVTIRTNKPLSVVLCEQVSTISKEKLSTYLGHVSDIEMALIEKAVCTSLGISRNEISLEHSNDYLKLQIENKMLREFNEHLLQIAIK